MATNDIGRVWQSCGCVDTAIIRIYENDNPDNGIFEMEVIKDDRLLLNVCDREDGSKMFFANREQQEIILRQLAEYLGYDLTKRGG